MLAREVPLTTILLKTHLRKGSSITTKMRGCIKLVSMVKSAIEGVNEGGIGVVLLIDLGTQVIAKHVVEAWHFISIHWQVDSGRHIEQHGVHHAERQVEGIH